MQVVVCAVMNCYSKVVGLMPQHAAENGIKAIELGMSHRGRLNVLHTILSKPLGSIITEFKNTGDNLQVGDVKYHLGTRGALSFNDKTIQISLLPNPSHLEAVNPVVLGKTRAKQFFTGDTKRSQNLEFDDDIC
ncbi:hypothetical protein KC19_4G039400 [Ceratodon purpureus]|uniref:Uncharacterized protein n=1 Tax=Ceratodon purpureus TaxID=3225 RepID=A0A8T0I5A4_CERPU|nr:hypothetical protein KC19_4G039400 [Ceratodon purpureus]